MWKLQNGRSLQIKRELNNWKIYDASHLSIIKSQVLKHLPSLINHSTSNHLTPITNIPSQSTNTQSQSNMYKVVEALYSDILYAIRLHNENLFQSLQPADKMTLLTTLSEQIMNKSISSLPSPLAYVSSDNVTYNLNTLPFTEIEKEDGTIHMSLLPTAECEPLLQIVKIVNTTTSRNIYTQFYLIKNVDLANMMERLYLLRSIYTSNLIENLKYYKIREEVDYDKRRITFQSIYKRYK